MLLNAARDLRTKADNVVRAFNKRIATMDDARIKLEMELTEVTDSKSAPAPFRQIDTFFFSA